MGTDRSVICPLDRSTADRAVDGVLLALLGGLPEFVCLSGLPSRSPALLPVCPGMLNQHPIDADPMQHFALSALTELGAASLPINGVRL